MRNAIYALILMTLAVSSCTINEPSLPSWDTDWTVYLPSKDFVMADAIDDSILIADTTANNIPIISFSISDSTDWQRIQPEDLAMDSYDDSFNAEIGDITLNNASDIQTDYVNVMDQLPQELLNLGDTWPPYNDFEMHPDDDTLHYSHYESVHIKQGHLWLTFYNDMFLTIDSGLTIAVYNSNDLQTSIGTFFFDRPIPPGTSLTSQTVDLAGKEIGNTLRTHYILPIAGTDTVTVLTDEMKQGGFYMVLSMDKLVVDQASAKIPQQSFEYSDSLELTQEDLTIHNAQIDKGRITVDLDNHLNINTHVIFKLPDFVKDGQPKVVERDLIGGQTQTEIIDLSGYQIMNAEHPSQAIDYIHYDVTTTVDSTEDYVQISSSDYVAATIHVDSLYLASFEGELSPISLDIEPQEIDGIDLFKDFNGEIRLTDLEMRLTFENQVDFPLNFDFNIVGYHEGNTSGPDSVKVHIQDVIQKSSVNPQTVIVLNGSTQSPSVVDLLAILPTKIKFYGQASIQGQGGVTINDGIRVRFTVSSPMSIDLQDSISQETAVDSLTSNDLDPDTQNMLTNEIKSAYAQLVIHNALPIGAEVYFYMATDSLQLNTDFIADSTQKVVIHGLVEPGETDASGYVNQTTNSTVEINLTPRQLELFGHPPLYLKQKFIILPTQGTIRFRQEDKIGIEAMIRVQYTMNKKEDGNK